MDKLCIEGGKRLEGRVPISGAKNSAVALIPAALLAESPVVIDQLPHILDVDVYIRLLKKLRVRVDYDHHSLRMDPALLSPVHLPNGQVKKLRASSYLMGASLGRFGEAVVGLPGGCELGPRPLDQHIKGFEALGARVETDRGALHIKAEKLRGTRIYLDVVSVGATINIMLAAVKAQGQTIIENVAKEPEIIDVATLLNSMGGDVKGAGTDVIKINGVSELHGCRHAIIPDRIEAGTFMIAAAATGGDVWLDDVIPTHLEPISAKLMEMGVQVKAYEDVIHVVGKSHYNAIQVKTLPYPGFPTDLQQPLTSLLTKASGMSIVTDNVYDTRFKHVDELKKMGADIRLEGRSAIIEGARSLDGCPVKATDLRAGAALVIAGLMSEGRTEMTGVWHMDRGYEALEEKVRQLGANIWREQKQTIGGNTSGTKFNDGIGPRDRSGSSGLRPMDGARSERRGG